MRNTSPFNLAAAHVLSHPRRRRGLRNMKNWEFLKIFELFRLKSLLAWTWVGTAASRVILIIGWIFFEFKLHAI